MFLSLLLGLLACADAQKTTELQLTDLDLWCMEKLGITTTTTTTPWFVTTGSISLAKEREIFWSNVKRDGYKMAEEFQAWLEVRVLATLLCITFGTPVLVMLAYRYSSIFRKWITILERNMTCSRSFLLLAIFLVAAGLCWFFSLRIVYTARLVLQDLQDYFLSSFITRLMDVAVAEIDNITAQSIGQTIQISSHLCNPTGGVFELRSFGVDGLFENTEFTTVDLHRPVHLEPESVGEMLIDYTVLQRWENLILPAASTIINSAVSQVGLAADPVAMLAFLISTDCVARDTQIYLGLQANVPIALNKLPEIWAWNQTLYENPTQFWADLYNAVNHGLKTERFLEWDSLNISGEAMTWVYMICLLCSAILVSSILMVMLLLIKLNVQCRICRRRPMEEMDINPVCPPEKVWGRSVSDLEIIIAEEQPQTKPHLTKAVSQSRLEASMPKGPVQS